MHIRARPSRGVGAGVGGGVLAKIPAHAKCVMHATYLDIEYLFLSGWMVTCVHDSVSGRGANQEYPLPPSQVKTLHATIAHVYSVYVSLEAFPHQSTEEKWSACVHDLVMGWKQKTHPRHITIHQSSTCAFQ
jgi:hypothetical protein